MESLHSAEVVIIGGGVAGISAALKLSEHSYVTLIEKKHLFWGSSGRNPGRMGHGFHYIDFETASMYLKASVAVQRNYPDFLIGKDLPFSHPIRHGRYFITKDSLYNFEQVMVTYRQLQAEYQKMVEEDPANEVFGPPSEFLKILRPEDYQDYVNPEVVEGAVETSEHLFNWPEFSKYIRAIIESHPRIRLIENTEVVDLFPRPSRDVRFMINALQTIEGESSPRSFQIQTNFIVNSSWENIDYLNETAGVRYINRMRTNRLKCLLEVQLPPSLVEVNSAFFCMGAFCMFSNMGDGRGMMTLADVTNMASSFSVRIDHNMERYVRGDVSLEEKLEIFQEIITGVSKYIPAMASATFMDVKFGIVQTKGELNLCDLLDRNAAHHVRNYHGIREEYQGLISNPAMKLFYFLENGRQVEQFYLKQLRREGLHQRVYHQLMESNQSIWKTIFRNDFHRAIFLIIDRMMLQEEEDPMVVVQKMSTTIRIKMSFHRHLSSVRENVKMFVEMFPSSINHFLQDISNAELFAPSFAVAPPPKIASHELVIKPTPLSASVGLFRTMGLSRTHSYSSQPSKVQEAKVTPVLFRPISTLSLQTYVDACEDKPRAQSTNSFLFGFESKGYSLGDDLLFPPSPRN